VLDVSPDLFEKFGIRSPAFSRFRPVHIVFCNPDTAAFAFVGKSSGGFVSSFCCSPFHAFTPCTCKIKCIIIRTSSICFTRLTLCNVCNLTLTFWLTSPYPKWCSRQQAIFVLCFCLVADFHGLTTLVVLPSATISR
jgi:hypothetical protein